MYRKMARIPSRLAFLTSFFSGVLLFTFASGQSPEKRPKSSEYLIFGLITRQEIGKEGCSRTTVAFVHVPGKISETKLTKYFQQIEAVYRNEESLGVLFTNDPAVARPLHNMKSPEDRIRYERAVRGLFYRSTSDSITLAKYYPKGLTDDPIAKDASIEQKFRCWTTQNQ